MLDRMLAVGVPKVEFEWDASVWKGPGKEPWWFRQCAPRLRQQYIDQLAKQGKWRGKRKPGNKDLHLEFENPGSFGCRNLAHFAVALAELDCTLRVTVSDRACQIRHGVILGERATIGSAHALARTKVPVPPKSTIYFDVSGPDAKKAVPIVKQTFEEGLTNHPAVIKTYNQLQQKHHGQAQTGGKIKICREVA